MTPAAGDWKVEHHRGPASAFHARTVPDPIRRALWSFDVSAPALVLGSTQSPDAVDAAATARAGVEVVRRRSGGGAVWLVPGQVSWLDVVLPADDPLAEADVSRSALWLGQVWARALHRLGVEGEVHTGAMVRSRWSDLVCFAGLAPGEVIVADRKVVGVSQRRTRAGARFQCAVLHHWDPDGLVGLLALDAEARADARVELRDVAAGVGDLVGRTVTMAAVTRALVAELRRAPAGR